MSTERCPYLGLAGSRTTTDAEPDADHRCFAQRPSATVDAVHQRAFCLAANYTRCSVYMDIETVPAGVAPESSGAAAQQPAQPGAKPPRWPRVLPWLAVVLAVAGVALVYGGDLLRSPAPSPTPASALAAAAPTPTAGAAVPGITPEPAEARPAAGAPAAPTLVAGGSVVALEPGGGDTGWWAGGDTRAEHLGDSYLYAGYYNGQPMISAARFDLRRLRRGAPILDGALRLTGLSDERFDAAAGGTWSAQLLDEKSVPDLARAGFQTLYNAPAAVTLFPVLMPVDLGVGYVSMFALDEGARRWLQQQVLDGKESVIVRIVGPMGGRDTLFAWDSGSGPTSKGDAPQLVLSLGAPPETPPALPAEQFIVATLTPAPANVMTAAADSLTATAVATMVGTYTPMPYGVATPTVLPANMATAQALVYAAGLPPLVVYTSTPANAATATANAVYATAVAITTGTFTPVPTDAVTPVVVLPTPIPQNAATAVVQLLAATAQAAKSGPPTALPFGAVVATVTPEPPVLESTATAASAATAAIRAAEATLSALTLGTYTPVPSNARTPTPGPTDTPLPLLVPMTLAPTPTLTPTPPAAPPRALVGKILFKSDRAGGEHLYAFDPATEALIWVTQMWPFQVTQATEGRTADGKRHAEVRTVTEITSVDPLTGAWTGSRSTAAIFVLDDQYQTVTQLTTKDRFSYDPAWSPAGDWIAFVSQEGGNDEIFVIRPDGSDMRRLTTNTWEWDKHPSWSPDGTEIVFWSNRETGLRQLWIMGADGSNQRRLLSSPYNDWDPIWVK